MEFEFSTLRRDLNSLGYFQTLSYESVPLVAKLLSDLKTTTKSLRRYMKIAQNEIKEKENIENSTEFYKTDCSKILEDCNDSHLTHLNHRSGTERKIKEVKSSISTLNKLYNKLILENNGLRKNVHDTELDQMKPVRPTKKTHGNELCRIKTNCLSSDGDLLQENLEMKNELNELKKELKNLQCQCSALDPKNIETFSPTEEDILSGQLSQEKVLKLLDDVRNLTRERNELEKSYKEALAKQHEAMRRAIHLAERNRELERELKDIDQMAIAVEEECNDAVNDRTKRLAQLESALKDALLEIQRLEKTITSMKKEKWEYEINKDAEKSNGNEISCTCQNDELNKMRIIEHDLNLEIDRLVQENAAQKRTIDDLEYKLTTTVAAQSVTDNGPGGDGMSSYTKKKKKSKGKKAKSKKKKRKRKGKGRKKGKKKLKKRKKKLKKSKKLNTSHVPVNSPVDKKMNNASPNYFPADYLQLPTTHTPQTGFVKTLETSTQTDSSKNPCNHFKKPEVSCVCGLPNGVRCCTQKTTLSDAFRNGCCANMCFEHFQYLLKKEIEKQYCKTSVMKDQCLQCSKIKQKLDFMELENKRLSDEKITLMAKLETSRDDNEIFAKCNRSVCKRTQRERDLFKADVARLEEETDCLRDKYKELSESKKKEHESLRLQIYDCERTLRKYESERSELMNTKCTSKAQINAVDKKNEFLEQMLRNSQDDLKCQKLLYAQLKALHDQTDKALFNTRTQLNELEQELASARNTIETLKQPKADDHFRVAEADLDSLKRQLNRIDREKDDLLNIVDSKTEEIATLRRNLIDKCGTIENLKTENHELRTKFGDATDCATTSGAVLKESEIEIRRLQNVLDETMKTKNNAVDMNRKLQEELATLSRELITLQNQVADYKDQIANLKIQSQQYISEVKKAEDLLQNKEKEREDLLNQFKLLCKESNDLQSSNNVLETEASQSKVQLSVAMDHVTSLEQRSETLEILINDYEKQIGLLTNQIAKLEIERNQHHSFQERTETELRTMRELCMKLDKEKENLRLQLLDSGKTEDKLSDLIRQNHLLTSKLSNAALKLSNAEKLLTEARQEGVDMKLKNEETVNEIQYLKEKIADLENRLVRCLCKVCSKRCSIGLEMCEKKCLDMNNQDVAPTTENLSNRSDPANSLALSLGTDEPLVSRFIGNTLFAAPRPTESQTDSMITNCSKNGSSQEAQIMATSLNNSRKTSFSSSLSNHQFQPEYIMKETTHETLRSLPISSVPPTIEENDVWTYQPTEMTSNSKDGNNLRKNLSESICRKVKCYPGCKLYNPVSKTCNKYFANDKNLKNNSSSNK